MAPTHWLSALCAPVGLRDPRSGNRSKAILQLRQDNVAGTLYNLVGFQTNLKFGEQKRIFSMIPGLENAEFARYGMMHRNTFLAAPRLLNAGLQFKERENLFCAGQLTGIEGYAGNIASGLARRRQRGPSPPGKTAPGTPSSNDAGGSLPLHCQRRSG